MKLLARGPVRLLLLGTAVTTMLVGASAPLNPLVVRTPSARGTVPVDCDQSLSPTPPQRVEQRDIRDIPLPQAEPAEAVAPPSTSLRTALQATQNALVRNDRPEFNRSLETARSILLHYPTGAERRTGEELLRIYDAAARLWDAQFQSPFFDETAPEYALVSGYPGYAEAVRRSTITDASGRRFYPAAESREFLARIAADRLRGIGIATPPPRVARSNRPATEPATPDVTPTTRPRKTTQTRETIARNTPAPAPSTTTTATTTKRSTRATTRHPASTPARAHASSASSSKPRRPTTTEVPQPRLASGSSGAATAAPRSNATQSPATQTPAPVSSTPSTPNPSAAPITAAAPAPAAPVAGTTPSPAAASPAVGTPASLPDGSFPTETTGTTDTTLTTDTAVATATTAPPDDPRPAAETPSRTRSVVLPTILILIGLGVLIVLFRASK